LFERIHAPRGLQFAEKTRGRPFSIVFSSFFPNLIRRVLHGVDGRTADPMSRALIGNSEAPPSSTSSSSLLIAAKRNRPGTGDDNRARTRAKGRRQRDLHVTHYFDFP